MFFTFHLQAPTAQGGYGAGEQPSGPIKLTWRQGQPVPVGMESVFGSVVVHGNTAYFSCGYNVYSYTVPENKWTKLPQCKYGCFTMAVINDALTTIGGRDHEWAVTNTLLSLSGSSWEEVLPPMPTKPMHPAAANTPTHLVVAGGTLSLIGGATATVELLNTETLQWSTASSLPEAVAFPQMTTCGGCLYLTDGESRVFSCSVKDLLKSTNSSDCCFEWTRLASIPTSQESTLATLRERVLAIGGYNRYSGRTGAILCYDVATNSWSVRSEMPTPRSGVLTAVLPSDELVVVGGYNASGNMCSTALEIGSS